MSMMLLAAAPSPQTMAAVRSQEWKAIRFAAKDCGVEYRTALAWAHGGLIEARQVGRRWHVRVDSLRAKLTKGNPWQSLVVTAKLLGIDPDQARKLSRAGLIETKRVGHTYLVRVDSLKDYIASSKTSDAERFAWIIAEAERVLVASPTRNRIALYRSLAATAFGFTIELLQSKSRGYALSVPRQKIMCFIRLMVPGASWQQIGAAFGVDHTTVIHAARKQRAVIEPLIKGARQ